MRKGNLIKMAAPAILSAAMMVSGLPVMAADFTSDTAVETRHRQMSLMQQMTPLMLLQAMRKHLLLTIRQQQKMNSLQQQKQATNMSMQV